MSTTILRKVELLLTQALANGSFFDARVELTLMREDAGMYYLAKTTSLATEYCDASQDTEESFDDYVKARKAFLNEFNHYTAAGYQMV